MNPIIIAPLIVVLLIASYTDLTAQRIPNWLTFPAAAFFLAARFLLDGSPALTDAAQGLGLGFILLFIPHLFGVMGAGDVKLMAAVGAALGTHDAFVAVLATSLLGGLYALVVMAARRDVLRLFFAKLWTALVATALTREMSMLATPVDSKLPRLCYGVAIACGTGTAIAWPYLKPVLAG